MWVYECMDGHTFTVGFYTPVTEEFVKESNWPTAEEAADRVAFLNGGSYPWAFHRFMMRGGDSPKVN